MKRCEAVADQSVDRKQWLLERKKLITASDVAVIMGCTRWKTPLKLFDEKMSEEEPEELDNKHIRRGKRLEGPIVEKVAKSYFPDPVPFRRVSKLYRSVQFPWLGATPDALLRVKGASALLECKAPSAKPPMARKEHVWQLVTQMAVTGIYRGVIAYGVENADGELQIYCTSLSVDNPTGMKKVGDMLKKTKRFHDCIAEGQLPMELW